MSKEIFAGFIGENPNWLDHGITAKKEAFLGYFTGQGRKEAGRGQAKAGRVATYFTAKGREGGGESYDTRRRLMGGKKGYNDQRTWGKVTGRGGIACLRGRKEGSKKEMEQ